VLALIINVITFFKKNKKNRENIMGSNDYFLRPNSIYLEKIIEYEIFVSAKKNSYCPKNYPN
jgi:hypothetical protein